MPLDMQAPPAIIIVVMDDVGTEHLAPYGLGGPYAETPTIDSLAEQGQVYTAAWATPVCSPTRASLLTGLYPFKHGIGAPLGTDDPGLPLILRTLPQYLTNTSSAMFGKWHLGLGPESGGTDAPRAFGFVDAAITRGNLDSYFEWAYFEDGAEYETNGYATSWITEQALDWIANNDGVVLVSYHAAHAPLHCPPGAIDCKDELEMYHSMLSYMDAEIGRLVSANPGALFIVIGDNGSPSVVSLPPYQDRAKSTVYQGGVLVPLIVAGPGVVPAAVAYPVSVVDILPTLIEITESDDPPTVALDGRSFAPLLSAPETVMPARPLWTESFSPPGPGEGEVWRRAARARHYKMIRGQIEAEQMFDLAADPYENDNLLDGRELTQQQRAAHDWLRAYMNANEEEARDE